METVYYDIFKKIFPAGASFAFAYGSSVFKQIGHTSSKSYMLTINLKSFSENFYKANDKPFSFKRIKYK
ncbi:hypothetical protein Avbf_12537 [Armadillidium vulgare]|nr:hypothetical protein Avbf_12537 [Armadillidium vulgare]